MARNNGIGGLVAVAVGVLAYTYSPTVRASVNALVAGAKKAIGTAASPQTQTISAPRTATSGNTIPTPRAGDSGKVEIPASVYDGDTTFDGVIH